MNIKKKALENLIDREIADVKSSGGMLCDSRFAIECGDGYEVQVVITSDQDNFLGQVIKPYREADDAT